jgi:hypothetical protein
VDAVFTPEQLAERYPGITVKTLADWRYKGAGPGFFRAGKRVFYREADVLAWEKGRAEAQAEKRAS